MTFRLIYKNCATNAEIVRDYHPGSIIAYNNLAMTTKIMYPTILSAFKAGLLGPRIPLLPFKIEVTNPSLPYPVLCEVDPGCLTWDQSVCSQAGKIFGLPLVNIVTEDGQSISALGLDRVWRSRQTIVYRSVEIKKAIKFTSSGPSEMLSVRRRVTTAEGRYTNEYVDAAAESIETRLSEKLFEVLRSTDQVNWPMIIAGLQKRESALHFVNLVVQDESFKHVYDGRCFSHVLVSCGFRSPMIFVKRVADLFVSSLSCIQTMLMSSRCRIQHKMLLARFRSQFQTYRMGQWIRSVRDAAFCHPINRTVLYSSSSSDEECNPVIFERPGCVGTPYDNPESPYYLGEGIEEQEDIGALRLSNMVTPNSVKFRLVRRDAFAREFMNIKDGKPAYFNEKTHKKLFQRFSPTGTTLVEPGDLIDVTVTKASAEPINPGKSRVSRARSILGRAGRRLRRSLSPSSSFKDKPTIANAPVQYVRMDWVVHRAINDEKEDRNKFRWNVVASYRLRRIDEDYSGPGFVVPLTFSKRYAVVIYHNIPGQTNQWIYQGMRVFDTIKGDATKKSHGVVVRRDQLNRAIQDLEEGKPTPSKLTTELLRGRYVGYPPYLHKDDAGNLFISFPAPSPDPRSKELQTAPKYITDAWDVYDKGIEETGGIQKYWREFLSNTVYPKMMRIANVAWELANEQYLPFPTTPTYTGFYGKDEESKASGLTSSEKKEVETIQHLPQNETQDDYPYSGSDSGSDSESEDEVPLAPPITKKTPPQPPPRTLPSSSSQVPLPLPRDSIPTIGENGYSERKFTIKEDVDDPNNNVFFKKGSSVHVYSETPLDGFVWVSYDAADGGAVGMIPKDSFTELLPKEWPVFKNVSEMINSKLGQDSDFIRYENRVRQKMDKRASISNKRRVEGFTRYISDSLNSADQELVGCGFCEKAQKLRKERQARGEVAVAPIRCGICGGKKKKKPVPAVQSKEEQPKQEGIGHQFPDRPHQHAGGKHRTIQIDAPDGTYLFSIPIKKHTTVGHLRVAIQRRGFNMTDFVLVGPGKIAINDSANVRSLHLTKMTIYRRGDPELPPGFIQSHLLHGIAEVPNFFKVVKADGTLLFTVGKSEVKTYGDLVLYTERKGYPRTNFVLTGKNLEVPSDGASLKSLKVNKWTLHNREYAEKLLGIPSSSSSFVGSSMREDSQSPVGKGIKAHKPSARSVQSAPPQNTTWYSSNSRNVMSETRNNLLLSEIGGGEDKIGLNRSIMNETPISTDHVLARCRNIARIRKSRGDDTYYAETLMKLELAFDYFHCVDSPRVRIYRRTTNMSCREGLFAELRVNELRAVGETFDPEDPKVPAMAYDKDAFYFLRTAFDPINNEVIFNYVLDHPDEFIDILGYIVLEGKNLPAEGVMRDIAMDCYNRRYPPEAEPKVAPPIDLCAWGNFWDRMRSRRDLYVLRPEYHDEILEPRGERLPYETYGSLQGLPHSVPLIGEGLSELEDHQFSTLKEYARERGLLVLNSSEIDNYFKKHGKYPTKFMSSLHDHPQFSPDGRMLDSEIDGIPLKITLDEKWEFNEEEIEDLTEDDMFGRFTFGVWSWIPKTTEDKKLDKRRLLRIKETEASKGPVVKKAESPSSSSLPSSTVMPSSPSLSPSSSSMVIPSSGFEEIDGSGFDTSKPSGFDGDDDSFMTSTSSPQVQKLEEQSPKKSSTPLRVAQTNIPTVAVPEIKPSYPGTLIVIYNKERFVYDPLNQVSDKSQNYSSRVVARSDMNLHEVLEAFAADLKSQYGIDANANCMVVHLEDEKSHEIPGDLHEDLFLFKRATANSSPQIVLIVKDGHEKNYRGDIVQSSINDASSSVSGISELLRMVSTEDDISSPSSIGDSIYLESEHKQFNAIWKKAVMNQNGIYFGSCSDHLSPIFRPEVEHVVMVPHQNIFKRFYAMFLAKKMQFRDFIRARTFVFPLGIQDCRRAQSIRSIDGTKCVNIKHKYNTNLSQHCLRLNGTWYPIRRLDTSNNFGNYSIYALPHEQEF